MEQTTEQPLVSIIVPTYNSQNTIKQCLQSIKNQTYTPIETIVIDRHSKDKTTEIAKQFNTKLLSITKERSTAKNSAAKEARGEFLLFVDSDMTLAPKLVEECISQYNETSADAIIIPLKSIGTGSLGTCRKTERDSLSGLTELMDAPRFFRKTAFLESGGYDESLVFGEDFDLAQRFKKLAYKIEKVNAELFHLEGSPSLYSILSKAYYYGKVLPKSIRKNPQETVKRYATLRFESLRMTGAMFGNLRLLLSFVFMKTLELVAYFAGISTQLIRQFPRKSSLGTLTTKLSNHKLLIANFTILTLISFVIFRNFFLNTEWPAGGDVMGFVSRAYLYGKDFRWLYIWRPHSFGFVEGINSMDLFLALAYQIFRDPSWTVKVFMFSSYLTAAFSMYIFAYKYTHKHIAALAGSLIYILNQWLFSQLTEAHADILFSYALAPLVFLFLDNALKSGKMKDIALSSLGLSLFVTGFHPECIVVYGVFLAIFALFFLLFPSKPESWKTRLHRFLKVTAISAVVVFALSAFFLIPFLSNIRSPYFASSYQYPLEDSLGSSYPNLNDAFTLRAVEQWGYVGFVDLYTELGVQELPLYSFLLVIFIIAYCTLLIRLDRYTCFFALSMLIAIFIAKGPHPPFGQIFTWAWFNIPHFAVFRAASRWVMMTAFSHAFFISLLVFYLTNYVKGKSSLNHDKYFEVSVKTNNQSSNTRLSVSFKGVNAFLKKIRRLIYALCVVLLALIFLTGPFSSTFFLSNGLQVYTPSSQYLAPYEWLAYQSSDYKVISVSRGPAEWNDPANGESDFASSGMLTSIGWTHDIGFDSSFIHDKPVLQDGGWDAEARKLLDYFRFKLAREHLTENLFKILGTFAYDYIVLPSYTTNNTREFFLNQKGYDVIYNQTAIILKNNYLSSRTFAVNHSMLILGGPEAFEALSKIDSLNFNTTSMFFMPKTIEGTAILEEMLSKSDMLCFADSDVLDMAFVSMGKKANLILAGDYGVSSLNLSKYWTQCSSFRTTGAFVLGGDTLTTCGKNKIDIPFELGSSGLYEMWVRVGLAPGRGKLTISVDNAPIGEIRSDFPLMAKQAWVNITRLNLDGGEHAISLENDGTGCNDVDALAIVNPVDLETQISEIISSLGQFKGRIMYLMQSTDNFLNASDNIWSWTSIPYNGYVIRSESSGLNVSPLATANASSTSDFRAAIQAIDGNLSTRWASEKYRIPQWLELTWEKPQKIAGARILFENAYAADYFIQTWNGTHWVSQAAAKNNTALENFHIFPNVVETNKLRIYVLGFSPYSRVSIWELEALTPQATSVPAEIVVPQKGRYMLAARVGIGPGNGTLCFNMSGEMHTIYCNGSTNHFEWRETGPFSLDAGEQYASIGGLGPVELDEILVYSLKEGEDYLSLHELFDLPVPNVSLECRIINPCLYEVNVNAMEPFTLVFSEAYNPLWKAVVDGQEFSSARAYSLVNSYDITKTGEFKITLCFTAQSYAETGLLISLSTCGAIVVSALVPSKIRSKIVRGVKRFSGNR
ncbi:MAG TPA: glycosyltransferase [Candidatus Bathyarchaeia archaeon]